MTARTKPAAAVTTVRDPLLGLMKLDPHFDWLEGRTTLWGARRDFTIEIGDDTTAAMRVGGGTLYMKAGTLFIDHGISVRIRNRAVSELVLE